MSFTYKLIYKVKKKVYYLNTHPVSFLSYSFKNLNFGYFLYNNCKSSTYNKSYNELPSEQYIVEKLNIAFN